MRARTAAKVVIAAIVILLLFFASDVVLLLFAGILLAVMLRALSDLVAKYARISPRWALVIVALALVLSFSLIGWMLAPAIGEQVDELRAALPAAVDRLQQELSRFGWLETLLDGAANSTTTMAPTDMARRVSGALSGTLSAIANIFIVLVIAFYLAGDPRPYIEGTVRLFPVPRRDRAREVLNKIGHTLRWWLIGKAASMLIIGIATFTGLTLLGVPLAGALALISGLLSFIPNIGPILALIPAALFALLDGPVQVLYVVVLYNAIQAIETYILTPQIERRTVALPPALTLTMMAFATVLLGWMGLLLAAPATAALLVLVQMVYLEDVLGERNAVDGK